MTMNYKKYYKQDRGFVNYRLQALKPLQTTQYCVSQVQFNMH